MAKLVTVEEGEWRATLFAFSFFFFLLASYFILRSIRDAIGVAAACTAIAGLLSLGAAATHFGVL